ncbi:SipW-dependent-type signal peptide-containing protein [Rhodococcus cerastii]|nr:SipW-dependent-type signal peptide-containing protein [Rhodococcus cerastii]
MATDRKAVNRRKVRALLAGGLVLGIGAAVTLAAWTDNVFGDAQFQTGSWNLQGSFDGLTTWGEYQVDASAGHFTFSTGFAALSPGTTVYAPVALRIGPAASTLGATVQLLGATGGDAVLKPALRYSVYRNVPSATCTAAGIGSGIAWVGTTASPVALTAGSGSDVTLAGGAAGPGTPVELCFAVTLPAGVDPSIVSGQDTGRLLWQFTGQSTP